METKKLVRFDCYITPTQKKWLIARAKQTGVKEWHKGKIGFWVREAIDLLMNSVKEKITS